MEVEDLTRATSNPEIFSQLVERMTDSTTVSVDGSPVDAVKKLSMTLSLTDEEQGGILNHLVRGQGITEVTGIRRFRIANGG